MNHTDHVHLLRKGVSEPGGVWADLGSGSGAFTLALAELLGPTGRIYSVDKDSSTLRQQEHVMRLFSPLMNVTYIAADFTHPLALSGLDGVVMANTTLIMVTCGCPTLFRMRRGRCWRVKMVLSRRAC
ncbi:MAG: hypothetical protein NVSMB38_38770 [Ktedonobacteraceae bacterium]